IKKSSDFNQKAPFWTKSELSLNKILIANFDCRAKRGRAENFSARAGREGKGVGGKGIPALPSLSPPLDILANPTSYNTIITLVTYILLYTYIIHNDIFCTSG
ncbi:MAG: hypothetical protein AAB346_00505, partial [Pseudomonadota bacterium]